MLAFLLAVHRFNQTELKYSWPAYLQCLSFSIGGPLFDSIREKMVAKLKTERILETKRGSFRRPTEVWYLRSGLMDDDGEYLLRTEERQDQLLSSHYKFHELSILGVRLFTFQSFLSDLKNFACNANDRFRVMSNSWHSKLANVLDKERVDLRRELRSCPIIPLEDGSWASPSENNIFFASTDAGAFVPGGIHVLLVDQAASQDHHRQQLYQKLGVKTLNLKGVCEIILETHKQSPPWRCSVKDLVSHASYMFSAREIFPMNDSDRFWLVDANGECARGKHLYMELPNKVRVSEFAMHGENLISLIDPLYLGLHPNVIGEWTGWLQNTLQVAWLPRLLLEGSASNVTPEFYSLMNHAPAQCLLLIRDHWDHYFPLGYHKQREHDGAVRAIKRNLHTRCSNGKITAIGDSFLPRAHMTQKDRCQDILPFLDISDPDNNLWQKLSLLGVATGLNLEFYLQYLMGIQGESLTANNAHDIYKQINMLLPKDVTTLR